MDNQPQKESELNFFKKHLNGFLPTSVCVIILYVSFQIMTQISSLQKEISELRASILTRDTVHEIARQQSEKFYREIKSDIEDSVVRKILEYHQDKHK